MTFCFGVCRIAFVSVCFGLEIVGLKRLVCDLGGFVVFGWGLVFGFNIGRISSNLDLRDVCLARCVLLRNFQGCGLVRFLLVWGDCDLCLIFGVFWVVVDL